MLFIGRVHATDTRAAVPTVTTGVVIIAAPTQQGAARRLVEHAENVMLGDHLELSYDIEPMMFNGTPVTALLV